MSHVGEEPRQHRLQTSTSHVGDDAVGLDEQRSEVVELHDVTLTACAAR